MNETLTIISLIISVICLICLAILIFLVSKKKGNGGTEAIKDIAILGKQIDNLSNQMKSNVELSMSQEMTKFAQNSLKVNETQNEKLERFQKNISDSINNRFDSLNKQMNDKLQEINKKVDDRLAEGFKGNNESMAQVRERLQAIDDAQKNIQDLSKDVINLKNVLQGNQTRGQFGEYQLSMVLHNVFGDTIGCYEEQYTMKKTKDGNDVRADAVVFMPEPNKMICIDSKFPFQEYAKTIDCEDENEKIKLLKEFESDVKKHITTIKDKYIVEDKTAPEAIMFIPNDGVFAFIHHNLPGAVEHARNQKVILTSPSTLPAILVTINMVRIEVERSKNVKEISKQITKLGKDFEMFGREWETFSRQLDTASKSREKLDTRVGKLTNKFDAIKTNEKIDLIEDNIEAENSDNESI